MVGCLVSISCLAHVTLRKHAHAIHIFFFFFFFFFFFSEQKLENLIEKKIDFLNISLK